MVITVFHKFDFQAEQLLNLQPATLKDRIIAQVIDAIILCAIINIILLVRSAGAIFSLWLSPMIPVFLLQVPSTFQSLQSNWWWGGYYVKLQFPYVADLYLAYPSIVQWVIYAVYYTIFLGYYGQTPGKMLKGLVVLKQERQALSFKGAFFRWLFYILSILPVGAGLVIANFSDKNSTLHDKLSHTTVWKFIPYP